MSVSTTDAPRSLLGQARAMATITRAELVVPERPDRWPQAVWALRRWGQSIAGTVAAATSRYPDVVALIDDQGSVTYRALWSGAQALAGEMASNGVGPGTTVGILCRDHRVFVQALVAAAQLGADTVLLNTGFAGPQVADVVHSEAIDVVVHDTEFRDAISSSRVSLAIDEEAVAQLSQERRWSPPRRGLPAGRLVVLTSGTTGRPKGARRPASGAVDGIAAILARVPMRARDTVVIAAPLFHGWGLTSLVLTLGLSGTAVVHRSFDAEAMISSVARHRAHVLALVPVMLQRALALGGERLVQYDTSCLRAILASGSSLGPSLATKTQQRFGPILYNIYGSTEVAVGTIATPRDLADAPACAGRQVMGVRVAVLDRDRRTVGSGETGEIFVGSRARFDGYTGGGAREIVDGMLASGDVGWFDELRRLHVVGRADDMIVSGGENVFPAEVEELLSQHPGVLEAAVIGVDDDDFGQRLKAFVVRAPAARVNQDELKRLVRDRLARHKVPREVVFLDALPRTATGKVMKRMLQ